MTKYIGYGWNDLENEIHVTDKDVKEIRSFMAPIHDRYARKDMKREEELNKKEEIDFYGNIIYPEIITGFDLILKILTNSINQRKR